MSSHRTKSRNHAGAEAKPRTTAITNDTTTAITPFRFFELPRELRNLVYANLSRTVEVPDDYDDTDYPSYVTASASCQQDLCLLSRQFKQEYEEEVYRLAHITLVCHVHDATKQDASAIFRSPLAAGVLSKVQHMTVRLNVLDEYGEGYEDSMKAATFAQEQGPRLCIALSKLPALRTLKRELYIDLPIFEECVEEQGFVPKDFFAMALPPKDTVGTHNLRSIEFSSILLLCNQLLQSSPDLASDSVIASELGSPDENEIIYRATPSTDPNAWHGLELETVFVGICGYKSDAREVRRGWYDLTDDEWELSGEESEEWEGCGDDEGVEGDDEL